MANQIQLPEANYSQLPLTESASTGLPSDQPEKPSSLKVGLYMVAWIVSSNLTILFNKWLIDNAGFKYRMSNNYSKYRVTGPLISACKKAILLISWHLIFATVVTQILAYTTTYLNSRHQLPNTWTFYLTTILPIGIVSSGSLVCSNFVYLYLSVAFIQMLKAASPVFVLLVSWLFGVIDPTTGNIVNIIVIFLSVAAASAGTIDFSWIGVSFQIGALAFEAVRVVMLQIMLSGEKLKMDPMVGLYYYAPVVALLNLFVAFIIEVPYFELADLYRVGFLTLFLNAAVAFSLNFTSMVLIGKTSGLVMSLSGIFKNLLLIVISVIFWHLTITLVQIIAYSITVCALIYYAFGYEKLIDRYYNCKEWVLDVTAEIALNKGISLKYQRRLWIALGVICLCVTSLVLYIGYRSEVYSLVAGWIWAH